MEKMVKKILIVDDHVIYREGLKSLINLAPDFQVVGGVGTVHECIEQVSVSTPDIILMDYSLPDGTGLDAARVVLAKAPACEIIFLTVYETDEILFATIRAGAKGFLLKSISGKDLLASLRALAANERAISRKMMTRVFDEYSHTTKSAFENETLFSKLTPRELDVLCELVSGATNAEIAEHLFLSANTVKHHLGSLLDKLGVENRREAATLAHQIGLKSKYTDGTSTHSVGHTR
jgi:DNA-binding NarL/FixJ family response regulator